VRGSTNSLGQPEYFMWIALENSLDGVAGSRRRHGINYDKEQRRLWGV